MLINTTYAREPRPATGILDQAGLFSESAEASLAQELRDGLKKHFLEVYVATYRLVKGETIAERATGLRNAWARNPFAVVLVYDESVGQISLVGSRDLEQFVSEGQLTAAFQRAATVAKHYLNEENAANRKPQPSEMLSRTVRALLKDPVLAERMSLPEPLRFTGPMFALLGALVLLASGAAAVVWQLERRLNHTRSLEKRCSFFPTTRMPLRLGAPYSGGQGATIGEP